MIKRTLFFLILCFASYGMAFSQTLDKQFLDDYETFINQKLLKTDNYIEYILLSDTTMYQNQRFRFSRYFVTMDQDIYDQASTKRYDDLREIQRRKERELQLSSGLFIYPDSLLKAGQNYYDNVYSKMTDFDELFENHIQSYNEVLLDALEMFVPQSCILRFGPGDAIEFSDKQKIDLFLIMDKFNTKQQGLYEAYCKKNNLEIKEDKAFEENGRRNFYFYYLNAEKFTKELEDFYENTVSKITSRNDISPEIQDNAENLSEKIDKMKSDCFFYYLAKDEFKQRIENVEVKMDELGERLRLQDEKKE